MLCLLVSALRFAARERGRCIRARYVRGKELRNYAKTMRVPQETALADPTKLCIFNKILVDSDPTISIECAIIIVSAIEK
jgi:hypothetical protein